ncbi:MAG: DUF4432 family protein [Phycisphaera sp.]|nr:DUF4432 family protein [Phycisphaera sp.]
MPSKTQSKKSKAPAKAAGGFDITKFENVRQVGGIQTALLEAPIASGRHTRVAFVDTGSGLRFTVGLDRGGDIFDAFYNNTSLAYLSPLPITPPDTNAHFGDRWVRNWPGGLLTTCGPNYVGGPRKEDGTDNPLHGHHSNTPASVEMILNPDPHAGRTEMLLSMSIRDARVFGPILEVRRQIQCRLGEPSIHIYDQVTNRGNLTVAHNFLYHINLGYPLLDKGARLIYKGKLDKHSWDKPCPPHKNTLKFASSAEIDKLKNVPGNLPQHNGWHEYLVMLDPTPDAKGMVHVGLVNKSRTLGFEVTYPLSQWPRLLNWQHFGERGSYTTGIEPYNGSLIGKETDCHPKAAQWLEPGQTRRYQMTLNVVTDKAGISRLLKHDGTVTT